MLQHLRGSDDHETHEQGVPLVTKKSVQDPDHCPVDGYINGLPIAVTQRSSSSAELSVIAGLCSEGEK